MLVVVDRKPYFWGPILFCSDEILGAQRSVRVLDSKPMGLRVRTLPASLARPINKSLLRTGSTQADPPRHNWNICVLRRKESNQTNCGLKGCAVLSHWRKIQQCQHACPMETDVSKTADGFKNVFFHKRDTSSLTAFQLFLLWSYNILIWNWWWDETPVFFRKWNKRKKRATRKLNLLI